MNTFDWVGEIKTVHVVPGREECDERINALLKNGWRLIRHFERQGPGVSGGQITDHYVLLARQPNTRGAALREELRESPKKMHGAAHARQIYISK